MTTEYTTYGCPACGVQHRTIDGSYGEMCPDLRKAMMRLMEFEGLTEERVREIAREEIRAELRKVDHATCEMEARAAHNIYEEELRKARDSALEEAALVAEEYGSMSTASSIRSLKSQPAAQASGYHVADASKMHQQMTGALPMNPLPMCGKGSEQEVEQTLGAAAGLCDGIPDDDTPMNRALLLEGQQVIAALRKERDDLRAKLAEREKSIADVGNEWHENGVSAKVIGFLAYAAAVVGGKESK